MKVVYKGSANLEMNGNALWKSHSNRKGKASGSVCQENVSFLEITEKRKPLDD